MQFKCADFGGLVLSEQILHYQPSPGSITFGDELLKREKDNVEKNNFMLL